jgi:hypothetical protein
MELFITQLSPTCCRFIPHRSKCFPRHSVLQRSQSVPLLMSEAKFRIHIIIITIIIIIIIITTIIIIVVVVVINIITRTSARII